MLSQMARFPSFLSLYSIKYKVVLNLKFYIYIYTSYILCSLMNPHVVSIPWIFNATMNIWKHVSFQVSVFISFE